MRVWITAVVVLLVALLTSTWLWQQQRDRAAELAKHLAQAEQERDRQRQQAEAWGERFSALGGALAGLQQQIGVNQDQLNQALRQLGRIEKQEGDSDETIDCLDRALPGQLDQWLRDPRPHGR